MLWEKNFKASVKFRTSIAKQVIMVINCALGLSWVSRISLLIRINYTYEPTGADDDACERCC